MSPFSEIKAYGNYMYESDEDLSEKIIIKYHTIDNKTVPELKQISVGNWIDLYCAKDTIIKNMELSMVPLGVSMQLPEEYEAHILPRSSTFKKHHIIMANSMGIVDNSYRGDDDMWYFPAIGIFNSNEEHVIPFGERICQFRIVKSMPKIKFNVVDTLDNPNRGGFGSTDNLDLFK